MVRAGRISNDWKLRPELFPSIGKDKAPTFRALEKSDQTFPSLGKNCAKSSEPWETHPAVLVPKEQEVVPNEKKVVRNELIGDRNEQEVVLKEKKLVQNEKFLVRKHGGVLRK